MVSLSATDRRPLSTVYAGPMPVSCFLQRRAGEFAQEGEGATILVCSNDQVVATEMIEHNFTSRSTMIGDLYEKHDGTILLVTTI